jgi:hypothetical protein
LDDPPLAPLKREKDLAHEGLARALETPDLRTETVLAAVNTRRSVLGLGPIAALTPLTSLRDGLGVVAAAPVPRLPKVQAAADIGRFRDILALIRDPETSASCAQAIEELTALNADPAVADGVAREHFLQTALDAVERCMLEGGPRVVEALRSEHAAARTALVEEEQHRAEHREREVWAAVWEALHALEGDPTASWTARHRRWHPPAVKARLVRKLGGRAYLEKFPW